VAKATYCSRLSTDLSDNRRHTARQRVPPENLHADAFPQGANCQISKSEAAGDVVMGFRLVDGPKIIVYQIDGADREHDPERNG
jgi:hypothetical protein